MCLPAWRMSRPCLLRRLTPADLLTPDPAAVAHQTSTAGRHTRLSFLLCVHVYYSVCIYAMCVYLHPHVGQDDAAGHPALRGGAAKPLKVLVHAVLPERRLDRPRRPSGHKLAPVLPLQHLHLSGSTITHRQPIREQKNKLCSLSPCGRTRNVIFLIILNYCFQLEQWSCIVMSFSLLVIDVSVSFNVS